MRALPIYGQTVVICHPHITGILRYTKVALRFVQSLVRYCITTVFLTAKCVLLTLAIR